MSEPVTMKNSVKLYEQTIDGDEIEVRMRFKIAALEVPPKSFRDEGEAAALSVVVFACRHAANLLHGVGTMPPHVAQACSSLAWAALDEREAVLARAKEVQP